MPINNDTPSLLNDFYEKLTLNRESKDFYSMYHIKVK